MATKKNEVVSLASGDYIGGRYIPQSGTGTWKISGSGTGLNAAGQPIGTRPPETVTQTTSYTPSGPRPVMGDVATAKIPGAPILPEYETPEMGELPTYVSPEWDEEEISRLTQLRSSAGRRGLRAAVQAVSAQRFENPNVRRMTLRDALRGYGEGLESVMSGASVAATSEYGKKYETKTEEARINYSTAVQSVRDIYNADLHSADMNFQAQIDNIRMVYGTQVAAEMQRVADVNAQNRTIFAAAMEDYLGTGTTTITKTTAPGSGDIGAGGPGSTTAEMIAAGGSLAYRQQAWDAKKAGVDRMGYNDPLRSLAVSQLGTRPA